ncbi:AraC family transcriptional regulator [Roseisolibacter sp. H3M3-2]|uniref:helix-turn-helix domain-containing protein n=1 Tax=Roseisolibacter sp. H3M3-2 TaxID=3031323 RepID=UPI0023DC0F68|nr:AraC family transcriptional regulator [Roseisolibacter sp. H3M3-2]MDF1502126.1 AraC family transcriptional regulator [Roseisolibacter sp. H3M3-2]
MTAISSQFVSWDGGCVFLSGRSPGVTPMHAHYAIQLAFGVEPGIRFRPGDAEPWTAYRGVVIPSRQPHTMDATGVSASAVLFVEPETREGRALAERFAGGGIAPLPDDVLDALAPSVFSAWRDARSAGAVEDAARRLVHALAGGAAPSVVSDERILRAVAYIKAHLDRPLALEEVAAEACLSPSRFRHLFVEETGVGLRPYVLWRRFLRVWELLTRGSSLSAAAHAAGFADAAHLSRTSRTMFGFPPSAMQMVGPLDAHAPAAASATQPLRSTA